MGKALSIKDEETCDMVVELAKKTGQSMTLAVKNAVAANLREVDVKRSVELYAWVTRMESMPPLVDFEFERDMTPYKPRDLGFK